MIVTHQVTIDLLERKAVPQIEATQNDQFTRELIITLMAGEEPWQIPEDATVVVRYCASDGTGGIYDTLPDGTAAWQAEGNILRLALAPQALTIPGTVILSASVYLHEKILSIFSIAVKVHPLVEGEPAESHPYVNVTGFLPAPADAREGKFLRIAQVDEFGNVIALEAVDVVLENDLEPEGNDIPVIFFEHQLPDTKDDMLMQFRYSSHTLEFTGWCKTKAQGNSSMNWPKKNQTVKLYRDSSCREKMNLNFRNWGEQNKFCFKANWIDLTHARNVVSARLWGDVIRERENFDALPELYRDSPNMGAVDGFPVKVYAGGVYQGRYTLNIPKEPWMAGMDDRKEEHCILCGENYVSGCFRAAARIDGSDWSDEVHGSVPDVIRIRWNDVIDFVRNSTDEEFKANIEEYFYLDSLIDYHLFGLMSCGLDAYGKNQLYMTYNSRKWIAGMYDMDATWGLWWDGAKFVAKDYDRSQYQDFQDGEGNLLYIRLEQCFYEEIQRRWSKIRSGSLSVENILLRFERFVEIAPEALVKEDYAATTAKGEHTGIPLKTANNIQQIRDFVEYRHRWCDDYVDSLTPAEEVACTGIALNLDGGIVRVGDRETLVATVTPANCTEDVVWTTSNPGVAEVVGGEVTFVGAGDVNIIATCGAYSTYAAYTVRGNATVVACSGITLSETALSMTTGDTATLTATVLPAGCTEPVFWETSDSTVAVVSGGVVTATGVGEGVITVRCGAARAQCNVSVSDSNNDLLTNVTWYVGEIGEHDGQIVDTATAGNYTDAFDISCYAGSNMRILCDGCNTNYSRVAFYDGNRAWISCSKVPGNCKVPVNAKYARISIIYGTGRTVEVWGGQDNLWDLLENLEGSYAGSVYKPGDVNSNHIRFEISEGDMLGTCGAWGVAFLDGADSVLNLQLVTVGLSSVLTAPAGTVTAAVCAEDTKRSECFCNRIELIASSVVG